MADFGFRVTRRLRMVLSLAWVGSLSLWPACSPSKLEGASDVAPAASGAGSGSGSRSGSAGDFAHAGTELVLTGGKASSLPGGGGENPLGRGGTSGEGHGGVACEAPELVPPGCVTEVEAESGALCNGLDDDCDGSIDEGCPCKPGQVQPCFRGPPGRSATGACAPGAQVCLRGGEFAARWSDCTGGIVPSAEVCDGLDNDCNGCADDRLDGCAAQWTCPGPGDPRTPDGTPLAPYPLRGRDFFDGAATAWSWVVRGGPCDELVPASPSFSIEGGSSETATFTPKLSGDYTVTLTVTPESGPPFTCSWIVHIVGPGLRIEMCYPESTTQDLDLYLKQPGRRTPWFTGPTQFSTALDQCSWANCEASLRGEAVTPPQTVTRADWGYPNSPLALCENDLQGLVWRTLGSCASPRLDIDNNLSEATGVPENINVDAPRDNETFRVMVANFSGTDAHPMINVYCDGRRTATIGAPPDPLPSFVGLPGSSAIGALWRAADVTTHVADSATTCSVDVLHPPGSSAGFDVTVDDPRY